MGTTVKVGDAVMWRGGFGMNSPRTVVVKALDVTEHPRDKSGGESVQSVSWDAVRENRVIFTLSNGHWAYSEQIRVPRRSE